MKLTSAAFSPFRVPLRHPLVTAKGQISVREGFVLALLADSGELGLGEASPAYWIGEERIEHTREALESIAGSVERHTDTDELRQIILTRDDNVPLTPAARCALDTALLDLSARARGVSIARLLRGDSRASVPVSALLAARAPDALALEARTALENGYETLKLKVGAGTIDDDLRNLAGLRTAIGEAAIIRLDANRAWTLEQASAALAAFRPYQVEFVEEPLSSSVPGDLARLKDASGVAVALDESITCEAEFKAFIERDSADFMVLKAARIGGPSRCCDIAALAVEAGVKVVVTDSLESAVGMSLAVHLAAALSPAGTAVGLGGARFLSTSTVSGRDFCEAPLVSPRGPGLDVSTHSSCRARPA